MAWKPAVLLGSVLCALLLTACTEPPPNPFDAPVTGPGRPGVSLQALLDGALKPRLGAARPAVLDSLALPNRIGQEPRRNPSDDDRVDTLRTLYYDGLEVAVYRESGSDRAFITGVTVSDSTYKTGRGLHVGTARDAVEGALGPPDSLDGTAYVYRLSDLSRLRIHFEGEAVDRMAWSFSGL